MQWPDVGQLPAFDIERGGVILKIVILIIDDRAGAALSTLVVVESSKAREMITEGWMPHPPVEINHVGVVFLDDLGGACQPIVHERRGNISPILAELLVTRFLQMRMGGAVKRCIFGIVHVGIELPATIK